MTAGASQPTSPPGSTGARFRPWPATCSGSTRVPRTAAVPNRSTTTRRALFCTYNAASLGDLRLQYYADKARTFAAAGADSATLSLIGDFQGVAPTDDELRSIGVLR
jgi:hypothetical protein